MVYVIVQLQVKDSANVQTVRSLLAEHGRLSRQEEGCVRFEAYQSQNDPTVFFLCEHWTSQAALDQHRLAKGFTEIYAPQILPLVDRAPHPLALVE